MSRYVGSITTYYLPLISKHWKCNVSVTFISLSCVRLQLFKEFPWSAIAKKKKIHSKMWKPVIILYFTITPYSVSVLWGWLSFVSIDKPISSRHSHFILSNRFFSKTDWKGNEHFYQNLFFKIVLINDQFSQEHQ